MSDDDDLFDSYPDWLSEATPEQQARVERILVPGPGQVALSEIFPCQCCEAKTPHVYVTIRPRDGWQIYGHPCHAAPGAKPIIQGRTVKCLVCDTYWCHNVAFKGYPHGPRDLLRLQRDE